MQNKALVLLSISLLIISMLLGGCSDVETQTVVPTTSKYPEKPITTIVPFSAGGGLDLTTRSLEKIALNHLGQPLIVINKPGSAGALGWNELAGASTDGYTMGAISCEMILLSLYGDTKYNYLTALSPIAQVTSVPMLLAVQADQPWQTLSELIDYAQKNPGKLKFGNTGTGSFVHILCEMLNYNAGIQIEQVPFSGGGETVSALLGGHVQLIFINPASIKQHVTNGTVRILAMSSENRMSDPAFAQIPTFKEQGFDITLTNWHGLAVPKEIPFEIKNKLGEKFKSIIADPEFRKNMDRIGATVEYLGPQESQDKWLADSQILKKTLQVTGVLEKIKAQKK